MKQKELDGSWWTSFMKRHTGRYGGEIIVHWWLKWHHIPHQEQVKVVLPFRARSSNYVYADFLLDYRGSKVWIEYNGEQHYQMVEAYHRYESDFRKQQRRDQAVRDFCALQDIRLLEIRHSWNPFKTFKDLNLFFKAIP